MSLIEILMSKEPSYIRCIKPNENKEPGKAGAGGSAESKEWAEGFVWSRVQSVHVVYTCLCLYRNSLVKLAADLSPWVIGDWVPSQFPPAHGHVGELPQTELASEGVLLLQGSLMIS